MKTESPVKDTEKRKKALIPPPLDIYIPQNTTKEQDHVQYGLNMYFKKIEEFSSDHD